MSVTLSSGDRITLGNGAGDIVNDSEGVSNRITLGNGANSGLRKIYMADAHRAAYQLFSQRLMCWKARSSALLGRGRAVAPQPALASSAALSVGVIAAATT